MEKNIKTVIYIALFVIFIAVAVLAYNTLSEKVSPQSDAIVENNTSDEQGEKDKKLKALDFTVLDDEGNEIKLSDLFGKPIVLNFWASWCPPCKSEMPEFEKVYNDVGEDIIFMMVDCVDGQRETMEKGKQYIQKQGFTFPVYYDTTGEANYVYGISSIPTTIFIDSEGYIITGAQGAIDEKTLLKGIEYIKED